MMTMGPKTLLGLMMQHGRHGCITNVWSDGVEYTTFALVSIQMGT